MSAKATAAQLFGGYLDIKEAAAYLGIHPSTLRRHALAGTVKSRVVHRVRLFSQKELDRVLDAGYSAATGRTGQLVLGRLRCKDE